MAIISTILGGVGGFLFFLFSLFYFDFGLLPAVGVYLASGLVLTTSIISQAIALERL